jgi:hypothetical protein
VKTHLNAVKTNRNVVKINNNAVKKNHVATKVKNVIKPGPRIVLMELAAAEENLERK